MTNGSLNLRVAAESSPRAVKWAIEAFDSGDAAGFVFSSFRNALALVFDNRLALQGRGMYEKCLILAFTGCRTNHSHWSQGVIDFMFAQADRARLRAAGKAIPKVPATVYRGISGTGRRRRRNGYSWTGSLDTACWFALRFGLPNPAVLVATAGRRDSLLRG